ncbi:MAG: aminotransferase class I/II-fold pyridoxal phosphate-dependent enzyme [Spirochaetales bacterium]|nr:aminotransferase class I/II-fold pyridoxal phosphate-dependent enzyme [Spirochaetales bacterium]
MDELARQLNESLAGTVVERLLSGFGKRFYFPKGIVAQSAEAKKHAHRLNATIGMATEAGQPMCLPGIRELVPALEPEEIFSYAPTAGNPALRELWKREMVEKNPALAGRLFSLPVVVAGLTHGISLLADLFTDPGDVVVVPDMFWGNYRLVFEGRIQARLETFPFFAPEGGLNLSGLRDTVARAARSAGGEGGRAVLVLNFPNNPTGYSPSREEAARICEVLEELARGGANLLVVLDDAYFGLFYEQDTYPHSLFSEVSALHENILAAKVDGPTKENLVWGFRVGFLSFGARGLEEEHYAALTQKLMGAVRASVSSCSQVAQSLLLRAMKSPTYTQEKQRALDVLKERYQRSREILARLSPPLAPLAFNSGYFLAFELKDGGAEELRRKLLHERGVGTISIQDRYLRVAYSSVEVDRLEELYTTIAEAVEAIGT